MVGELCVMCPRLEAENLMEEMKQLGIRPSLCEFRSTVDGYGRLELFQEMLQSIADMENSGFALYDISSNMVLLSYGLHNELPLMVQWLQKAEGLGIGLSLTYNSKLNSCPTVMSLLQYLKNVPILLEELLFVLRDDEALMVQEWLDHCLWMRLSRGVLWRRSWICMECT